MKFSELILTILVLINVASGFYLRNKTSNRGKDLLRLNN